MVGYECDWLTVSNTIYSRLPEPMTFGTVDLRFSCHLWFPCPNPNNSLPVGLLSPWLTGVPRLCLCPVLFSFRCFFGGHHGLPSSGRIKQAISDHSSDEFK